MGLTDSKAERRLVAYVPEWIYEKVVDEARHEGKSVSELVRVILARRYRGEGDYIVSAVGATKEGKQVGIGELAVRLARTLGKLSKGGVNEDKGK